MPRNLLPRLLAALLCSLCLLATACKESTGGSVGSSASAGSPGSPKPSGAGGPAATEVSAAVAPYVDQATVAVAAVNVAGADVDAIKSLIVELQAAAGIPEADRNPRAFDHALAEAKRWQEEFLKAGGRSVFALARMAGDKPDLVFVVPLSGSADAKRLTELMQAPLFALPPGVVKLESESAGSALVLYRLFTLKGLKEIKPVSRPDLEEALGEGGPATVKVAVALPADLRAMLAQTAPPLPPPLGGGASAPLIEGAQWASLAISLPPAVSAQLTLKAKDAAAAAQYRDLYEKAAKAEIRDRTGSEIRDQFAAAMVPRVEGDRVRVGLDRATLLKLAHDLGPALVASRKRALALQSMTNLHQISTAIIIYVQDHGKLPAEETLSEELKPYLGEAAERVWINPRHPEKKPGYVYKKPADKVTQVRSPSERIMAYEAFDQWGEGVCVAFADGHVDQITDQKQFEAMLKGKDEGGQ